MSASESPKHCAAAVPDEQVVPEDIVQILEEHGRNRSALISILGGIQARYRYLPEDALRIVAEQTGVSFVDVYAAATFYHSFSLKPKGKHIVQCCLGTACHVRGGAGIAEELQHQLGIAPGETTPDREFSLETVNCLGACALGPVVVVDKHYFSKVTTSAVKRILESTDSVPDESDLARDERVFPLMVRCPHCGASLLDSEHPIHGSPSICLTGCTGSDSGWVRLCGLYGAPATESEFEIPADVLVEYSCPYCRAGLLGGELCLECDAPMLVLAVPGGRLEFCSRTGCGGHMLELDPGGGASRGQSKKGASGKGG